MSRLPSDEFLSEYSNLEKLFEVPYRTLNYIEVWPTPTLTTKQSYIFAFYIVYGLVYCLSNFTSAFWHFSDENVIGFALAMTPALVFCSTFLKFLYLMRHHRDFYDMLNEMEKMFKDNFHFKATKVNKEKAKVLFKVNSVVFLMPCITAFFFFVLPLIIMGVKAAKGLPIEPKLPVASSFPWDVHNIFGYSVAYIFLAYSGYYVPRAFALDSTIMDLLFYCGTLFEELSFEVEKINDGLYTDSSQETARKLNKLVQKHVRAIDYSQRLINLLQPLILIQYINAALQICVSGFSIIATAPDTMMFTFIGAFGSIFSQAFSYSWGGNVLQESSTALAESFYFFSWLKVSPKNRKTLIMIIASAQKGIKVSVPFFSVSFASFVNILRTSGSYLALLNTLMNKQ